jgi:hypothetical protein
VAESFDFVRHLLVEQLRQCYWPFRRLATRTRHSVSGQCQAEWLVAQLEHTAAASPADTAESKVYSTLLAALLQHIELLPPISVNARDLIGAHYVHPLGVAASSAGLEKGNSKGKGKAEALPSAFVPASVSTSPAHHTGAPVELPCVNPFNPALIALVDACRQMVELGDQSQPPSSLRGTPLFSLLNRTQVRRSLGVVCRAVCGVLFLEPLNP